jgi:hypothetical protein
MRGDFAQANVNSNCEVISITTDEGETLPLQTYHTAKWIARPDTIYRCMLYYNKVKANDGKPMAEVISLGRVHCLQITPLSEFEDYKVDPVKFESLWKSKSGKYLNLHLQLRQVIPKIRPLFTSWLSFRMVSYPIPMAGAPYHYASIMIRVVSLSTIPHKRILASRQQIFS